MISTLMRLLLGRSRREQPIRVRFFTRQGCCLCDEALAMLRGWEKEFLLHVELVDVDGDLELVALHGERVPVLEINGRERMWGKISPVLLRRQLVAELECR